MPTLEFEVSTVNKLLFVEFLMLNDEVELAADCTRTDPFAVRVLPLPTVVFWFKLIPPVALVVPIASVPPAVGVSINVLKKLVAAVTVPVKLAALDILWPLIVWVVPDPRFGSGYRYNQL
ncbi:hypothetical protein IPG36_03680 [bacterium]|nr:MAG: hypothetical protein IPG36_03680 [bacterium]